MSIGSLLCIIVLNLQWLELCTFLGGSDMSKGPEKGIGETDPGLDSSMGDNDWGVDGDIVSFLSNFVKRYDG
jgi:hypothetical protein